MKEVAAWSALREFTFVATGSLEGEFGGVHAFYRIRLSWIEMVFCNQLLRYSNSVRKPANSFKITADCKVVWHVIVSSLLQFTFRIILQLADQ